MYKSLEKRLDDSISILLQRRHAGDLVGLRLLSIVSLTSRDVLSRFIIRLRISFPRANDYATELDQEVSRPSTACNDL